MRLRLPHDREVKGLRFYAVRPQMKGFARERRRSSTYGEKYEPKNIFDWGADVNDRSQGRRSILEPGRDHQCVAEGAGRDALADGKNAESNSGLRIGKGDRGDNFQC